MISTLIPYGLLALGLVGGLALFLTVKREIQAGVAKNKKRMEEITKRLDDAHTWEPATVYLGGAQRSGLNVNKRVQAMRMLRRNEDIGHIAAALGVSRKEVELLIHVHQATHTAAKAAGHS
jgi:hypothetical protein